MEQAARPARLLRFGVYEIDLEAGELRKSGRKIRLQEQPFQVLALLLNHPGHLVTREELQTRLWPADTFVDFDLGLNTAIKKIRAALGDSADNPTFVETLPRRGYRFLCQVEEIPSSTAVALPASENPASVETKSVPEATVNAGKTGHTWLRLALGTLILAILVAGLAFYRLRSGTTYSGQIKNELEKRGERGTQNATAYDFYLKGRGFLQADRGPDQSDEAIQAFDQAIKADPRYAMAYGLRGEAYMKKYKATREERWKAQAQADCDQAAGLDVTRPAGRICQGAIDNKLGLYKEAVKDYSAAIAIDSVSVRAYQGRAWAYQNLDKIVEAENDYSKASELEPGNWRGYGTLAKFYFINGNFSEAAKKYELAIKKDSDNSGLHSSLGSAYEQLGNYDEAVAQIKEAIRLEPTFQAYVDLAGCYLNARLFHEAISSSLTAIEKSPEDYRGHAVLARAYFWAPGQRELALNTYKRAIELAQQQLDVNPDDPDVNLMLSVYYAMLGKKDDALYRLELAHRSQPDVSEVIFWSAVVNQQLGQRVRALALLRQARSMKYSYADIMGAPELDSLHTDPEFQQFMSTGGNSVALSTNSELHQRTK